MKKLALLLVVLIVCTAGCSETGNYLADAKFDTEEYLPEYDAQNEFCLMGAAMCENENTCYGICMGSSFIMYMDKATGINGVLCGKPECMHDNKQCNGYVYGGCSGLSIYENKLYWVDEHVIDYLYCMNLDGTNREQVKVLSGENLQGDIRRLIHRGYVYTVGEKSAIQGGEEKSEIVLMAERIGSSEEKNVEIFREAYGSEKYFGYYQIQAVGNKLYFMLSTHRNEWTEFGLELYEWDSQTRSLKTLVNDGDVGFLGFNMRVAEEGIYICSGLNGKGQLHKYDFENKKVELVFEVDGYDRLELLEEYVFMATTTTQGITTLAAVDYDGNTIFDSVLSIPGTDPEISFGRLFCGGNSESVYYEMSAMMVDTNNFVIEIPLSGDGESRIIWESRPLRVPGT